MRWIGTFLVAALAVMASSQTTESRIRDAMAQWMGSPNLRIRLDGTRTFLDATESIQAHLHSTSITDANGRIVPVVEIVEGQNGRMSQRIVADGSTLYSYLFAKKEVQASTYIPENAPAGDVLNKLGDGLTALTQGHANHLVRLYNDLLHPSGVQFKSWIPGRNAQLMQAAGTYTDPIVPSRKYRVNQAVEYVMYTYGDPVSRNVVFELDKSGTTERIGAIYFAERKAIGHSEQLTDIVLRLENPLRFPAGSFTFVPPTGARFVAGPKLIP